LYCQSTFISAPVVATTWDRVVLIITRTAPYSPGGTTAESSSSALPFWKSSRLTVRFGVATVIHCAVALVSAVVLRAMLSM